MLLYVTDWYQLYSYYRTEETLEGFGNFKL